MEESEHLIREKEYLMLAQINNFSPYTCKLNEKCIPIFYKLLFTMVDGSVINILSNRNSSSVCYICGDSPVEMNLTTVKEKCLIEENYRFDLSTLHCWIRFFECLHHISYRLTFKKWQVERKTEKNLSKIKVVSKTN